MRLIFMLAPLSLLACAQPEMDEPADLSAGEPCDPSIFDDYIGQDATQAVAAEMMEKSGARLMRWIRPDMAVTMDYRPNRLNIHIDDNDKIVSANCG